ncbi:MAG TPA: hypothetical protein VI383_07110 [Gemmatimonadales bacterium]|nr:hypothetical protein [Gemmatimonadales bacterium]
MNRARVLITSLTVLAAGQAGCIYRGTPVPVAGDTRLLAGEWEGTYESEATGRSGIITFSLKAGTDSAFGDVLMVPRRAEYPQAPGAEPGGNLPRAMTRLLRISFVWCAAGAVTGRLDPYEDPDTGERIQTVFEGLLDRSTFAGTFVSVYATSGRRVAGTWTVTRKSGGGGPQVAPRSDASPRPGPGCRPPG